MAGEISKTQRRLLVAVNYLSLALLVFMVHGGRARGWSAGVIVAGVLPVAGVLVATFVGVFWRTGLWHLSHAPFEKIDEREAQVMYESLRRSYAVFAVVCVIILLVNAVAEMGHIPILIAVGLLYLAHTLPAAAA
ncbi:MAG: hypothetical protein PVJ42_08090, partial [bacterium]